MPRHTSFRFCLDLSVEQERVLYRHVGAARFAFNQALRLHKDARVAARRQPGPGTGSVVPGVDHPDGDSAGGVPGVSRVPWTGFDLINAFNAWKTSEAAGRRFLVGADGTTRMEVIGLAWRGEVLAQVFEEAAVDLGRGLRASSESRVGARKGPQVGLPTVQEEELCRSVIPDPEQDSQGSGNYSCR